MNLEGEQPLANEDAALYLVRHNTEMGMFSTMKKLIPSTRMKNWAVEGEDISNVSGSAGCIKIGGSSKTGRIVTPVLDCLTGNAKIEISFDAAPYQEDYKYDPLTAKVEVLSAATVGENNFIKEAEKTVAQEVKVTLEEKNEWKRYTITLDNVAPGSRIGIGGSREDGSTAGKSQLRMFLDNIQVKVVEYK